MYTIIHFGNCLTKSADISLENLLKGCVELLDETEQIKKQFIEEFPHLL